MNKKLEKYHFIGIGGIGMSALARILLDKKALVSGSDLSSNANTADLKEKGAIIKVGHSAKHISPLDTVVYSSDIKKSNPEFQAALALKCRMLHRSELLADLMSGSQSIAVAGTHGKTTTTSLVTHILIESGLDPTFAIGGMVRNQNGKHGRGAHFVAEADESDGSFLNYHPSGAIVTNVEPEHMSYFHTIEKLHMSFSSFMNQVRNQNLLFYCKDDEVLANLAAGKGTSYGFLIDADARILNFKQSGWEIFFDLTFDDKIYQEIKIPLIGRHNALNGAAAFALALRLGIEEGIIRNALKTFPGVSRRCQKRKEINEVLFLDDYAHHPTEIARTLEAVKNAIEERRLIVVFQPHRYTRTENHFHAYAHAFEMADLVLVTDIYSAGEEPIEGISAQALLRKMKQSSTVACEYLPKEQSIERLHELLRPHDVLITLGAGDITNMHKESFEPKKFIVGLVFGGLSCEHEISLRSSRFVYESLDPNLYEIHFFGIDKKGLWITGDEAKEILLHHKAVSSQNCRPLLDPSITEAIASCDLFLPILHGTYGEDGTLQGFFEMIGKPYTGPDNRAASLSMDKVLTKKVVESAGVSTPKDVSFTIVEWHQDKGAILKKAGSLTFPLYVKPVHLGSSVGIRKVEKSEELEPAIDNAFKYDMKVMVEEGKVNCRELEFAVLGNTSGYKVTAPPPGEKIANGNFVDYEKKYGQHPVQTTVNPILNPEILKKGQILAEKAYRAVGCSGMTRVDFLLDEKGDYWFFEMNPIPGLQKLSLFPKIWNREGVASDALVNRLIILALQRKRQQSRYFNTL